MCSRDSGFLFKAMVFLGLFLFLTMASVFYALLKGEGNEVDDVIIPRKTSMAQVAEILRREDVIDKPRAFKWLLRITGGAHRVRAGEFRFKKDMGLLDALLVVYHADPIVHAVTVPEGWNVRQIAQILARAQLISEQRFLGLTLTPQAAAKYHLHSPSLEGFLFPDTYTFSKIDGEEKIIDTMVRHFFAKFDRSMQERARAMGFTTEQLVTLASIIEKETGAPNERPLISSVFHNRLHKHMRLMSDPTTIYGIPNFNGNLTKKDLLTPTPYNTYTISGLPPGPIASPGYSSLIAALNPANTKYLYFVSNNQGASLFSETYAEHAKRVQTWQVDYFRKKNRQIGKVDKK